MGAQERLQALKPAAVAAWSKVLKLPNSCATSTMFFAVESSVSLTSAFGFAAPQDAANTGRAIRASIFETDFMMNSLFIFQPCDDIAVLAV
jgi:hypothetical protein